MSQFNQQFITSIIDRYRLELDDENINSIVATWICQYDRVWIVKAIVESLHRGRYKIKSVDSILSGWQRAGKPSYNFSPEFEREILQDLPITNDLAETQAPSTLLQLDDLDPVIQFPGLSSAQLNPEESTPFPHHDCRRRQAIRANSISQQPIVNSATTCSQAQNSGILGGRAFARAEDYLQDHRQSIPTPPLVASFKGEDEIKSNQINSHPNFQLFHTLRAIITPNNVQAKILDDLEPPSYSTDLA